VPLLFTRLGLGLLDPDEGLYADLARTMADTGDWTVPRFNGLPYLEKPPLFLWAVGSILHLTGGGDWAVRLWSAASALGTALLVWRMGRRLYGSAAGLAAALALLTMAGTALYVRKASTDWLFVFCLTLSLYGFIRDVERPERGRTRFLLFYLGAALAVLTKGLIGLALPALIAGITLLWVKRSPGVLNLGGGAAVFALVALPWHLVAAWRDPQLFWFYIVDNQVLRFLNLRGFVEDDVPVSTLGFLVVTFLWLFPWGVFVLGRPEPRAPSEIARWRPLVTIWALVVVGFFALSRSKLEYYALPALPAVALLAGAAWAAGRDIGRWLVVGVVGCVTVGAWALWAGAMLTPGAALNGLAELNVYYRILRDQGFPFPFESPRPFGLLLQALGVTLILGWGSAALCWVRTWPRASFACLVGVGIAIAALIVQLLHVVEPHHSARAVGEAIVGQAQPDDVIVHEGSLEYSAALPFYTGRRIVVVNGVRGDQELASRRAEARGYFWDTAELARQWRGNRRIFLVVRDRGILGIVTALPPSSVHDLGLYGSRRLYSNQAG
jgi:Dolichyl-phosphate-mannose-protein mannosyltransferase